MEEKKGKMEDKICEDCVYWDPNAAVHNDCGVCNRYPPKIATIDHEGMGRGFWPMTKSLESCGEFKKAKASNATATGY